MGGLVGIGDIRSDHVEPAMINRDLANHQFNQWDMKWTGTGAVRRANISRKGAHEPQLPIYVIFQSHEVTTNTAAPRQANSIFILLAAGILGLQM
jgi:hypothetical protein